MKKVVLTQLLLLCLLIVLPFFLGSCQSQSTDEARMEEMVQRIHQAYPQATLQDVYKTCYQDYFGAEHAISDTAAVARYLHYELSVAAEDTMWMPKHEATGWRHRFKRVSLACVLDGEMSEDDLMEAFLSATETLNTDSAYRAAWANEWQTIARIALEQVPEWKDEELVSDLQECANLAAAVHHSRPFHNTYHPHYRIVRMQ